MKEARNVSLGHVVSIDGDHVTLQVDEHTADVLHMLHKQDVELRIDDGRCISNDQRAKCFAMFRDIANWSGFSIFEVEDWMKAYYMVDHDVRYFSLSDTSIENARQFIDYLITFCLHWDVPFKTRTWDKIHTDYWFQYQCLLNRKCIICGKHGDIDHLIGTVGMGRDRRKIRNQDSYFDCTCRKHHSERHSIGYKSFMEKYQVKPIKLTAEQIKQLHIGGVGDETK